MKIDFRACFGCEDLKFAVHHSDRKEAAELIPKLMDEAYSMSDVEADVRCLLTEMFNEKVKDGKNINWDYANKHIDEQIKKVKEHYRAWVN